MLQCSIDEVSGVAVVRVSGEVDLASVRRLRDALGRAAERSGPVVIDFSQTLYIDLSGIRALEWLQAALQPQGRRMAVAGASAAVRRLISIVELDQAVPVLDSLEEAFDLLALSQR